MRLTLLTNDNLKLYIKSTYSFSLGVILCDVIANCLMPAVKDTAFIGAKSELGVLIPSSLSSVLDSHCSNFIALA